MKNKTIAIMQPYLFPYIGYFQLIDKVDVFVSFDDVQWIRRGWINRHTILKNNAEKKITLPVVKADMASMINQVSFCNFVHNDYLNQIKQSYIKAPNFKEIYSFIESVMQYEESNVANFVNNSICEVMKLLSIDTEFISSSTLKNDKILSSQDKIINICQHLNAHSYINNINGQYLYKKEDFKEKNIDLLFLNKEIKKYKQFDNNFIPYLSIIDVLMFNSIEATRKMVKEGFLIH